MTEWTFLTNHARVLLCIARDPNVRIRDIADCAGITERAAHEIVSHLCEDGYISKNRNGARNVYEVHAELSLRGTVERDHEVRELLAPLLESKSATKTAAGSR